MGQMTTPEQLFEHELQDIYYAERMIVQMLPTLVREATSSELSKAFEHHLKETRGQIDNLEQVFSELGKRAQGEQCPGIEGIKREHDVFMQEESPATDVRDMFLTGAAARTEHYEIAAYTGLVAKARALGETEAAKLLNENLKQEKEALKKVESISKDLLKDSKTNGGAAAGRRSTSGRSTSTSRGGARRTTKSSTRGKTTASSRRSSR
jgi:ferritin-like metal-binding protein YciE